ncbi:Uncharacterised protein [Pasteurella multocida subsp. septica]|nr:Uncharacterised protein [Pasteurella multocida subsp. septica]
MNINNNSNLQEASFNQKDNMFLIVDYLLKNKIMPTMDIGNHNRYTDPMTTQQLSSLESYCKDNFAEQKAKLQTLSETIQRQESKTDKLVQDIAIINSKTSEVLASKLDVSNLKSELNQKISDEAGVLSKEVKSDFKWLISGIVGIVIAVLSASYVLFTTTENHLNASVEVLKSEITETQKKYDKLNQEIVEIKTSNKEILNALSDIKSFQQEKQSTALK